MKDERIAEARAHDALGPELRFLIRRGEKEPGSEDLPWSMIFKREDGGGAALGEAAHSKKLEFIALGWVEDIDAFARYVASRLEVAGSPRRSGSASRVW